MELRTLMQQEMHANPVLEETGDSPEENEEDWEREVEELRKQDEDWREYFAQSESASGRYSDEADKKRQFLFDSQVVQTTLHEHLLEQLHLATSDPELLRGGEQCIGSIDQDGFLRATPEEIAESAGVSPEDALNACALIQSFHPPGVGARDLTQCLLIQLAQRGLHESLEFQIVQHHLDSLGRNRIQEIARHFKVPPSRIQEARQLIAHLQPKPGLAFRPDEPQQVVQPEAVIFKHEGQWRVHLNADPVPRLRISPAYKELLSESHKDPKLKDYLRERIRAGKFLIKCIHQRQDTIASILHEVIEQQESFLENGPNELKPLTMSRVAQAVGVHETTVSRAVANKFIETPWGVLPMKYFFTSGYRTEDGSRLSNTSVKGAIHELIQQEDKAHPLSDTAIVNILKKRGIQLARRTVAKYRSELNILSSNLRREV